MVASTGGVSVAGSARLLLVPHGVFFFKSTLKGISGIKHRPSTALELHCVRWVASLGWYHWGWWSHLSEPLPPGASHCPSHTCIPVDTPVDLCVYISLCTFTLRRGTVKPQSVVYLVSVPGKGEEPGICTASPRWPKHVRGGGEEMLKRRREGSKDKDKSGSHCNGSG